MFVGPVLTSLEGRIVSKPDDRSKTNVQVTDVINKVDLFIYVYFAISLFYFCYLVTFSIGLIHGLEFSHMTRYLAIVVKYVVRQGVTIKPNVGSLMLLWISVSIAVFVTVHGYLVNLVSTDLVAIIPSPVIKTLTDYLSPQFSSIPALAIKDSQIYQLVANARKGSQLKVLHEQLLRTSRSSLVSGLFKLGDLNNKLDLLFSGKIVLLTDNWEEFDRLILCIIRTEDMNGMHKSSAFTQGILNIIFSKQIKQNTRDYVEYKAMIFLEAGLVKTECLAITIALANEQNVIQDWKAERCMLGMSITHEIDEIYLTIYVLETTFKLLYFSMIISCLTLIVELLAFVCATQKTQHFSWKRRHRKVNSFMVQVECRQKLKIAHWS